MKLKEAWDALTRGDGITDGTFHAVVDGGQPQLRVIGDRSPLTFDRVEDLVDTCKDVYRETGSKWRKW